MINNEYGHMGDLNNNKNVWTSHRRVYGEGQPDLSWGVDVCWCCPSQTGGWQEKCQHKLDGTGICGSRARRVNIRCRFRTSIRSWSIVTGHTNTHTSPRPEASEECCDDDVGDG